MVINGSEDDEKREWEAIEERRKKAKLAKVHVRLRECSITACSSSKLCVCFVS